MHFFEYRIFDSQISRVLVYTRLVGHTCFKTGKILFYEENISRVFTQNYKWFPIKCAIGLGRTRFSSHLMTTNSSFSISCPLQKPPHCLSLYNMYSTTFSILISFFAKALSLYFPTNTMLWLLFGFSLHDYLSFGEGITQVILWTIKHESILNLCQK